MSTTDTAGPSHIIKRPRLTKILDETEARIILLCAPAGYGKTTLAREWVATRQEPVLWYSGGPAMADVAALAVDLAELFAGTGAQLVERIRFKAKQAETPRRLAAEVANAASTHGTIVVVDDYHYATRAEDADVLFGELVRLSSCRWVFTTRTDPGWLEPRQLTYGEAMLLGAEVLAMTDGEVADVLGDSGTLPQARGWPAVVGLAALSHATDRVAAVEASALYDFFAGDIYDDAPMALQRALLVLAAGGDATPEIADSLLGEDSAALLARTVKGGFATWGVNGGISMHPLLREFLTRKLYALAAEERTEIVRLVGEALIGAEDWDACLKTFIAFPDAELVVATVELALTPLLDNGRIATVRNWVELAERCDRAEAAPIWLARAELALREGRGVAARRLGEQAAAAATHPSLAARAYLVAARASHITEDSDGVEQNTRRAEELSDDHGIRMLALWLALIHAYEQQDDRANDLVDRLAATAKPVAEDQVRVALAGVYLATENDGPRAALALTESCEPLASELRDPMLLTSYRYLQAFLSVATGAYDEALKLSLALQEVGDAYGIDFVVSFAILNSVRACAGMRRLRDANTLLADLRRREQSPHVRGNATIAACRVAIAAGDFERALVLLDSPPPVEGSRALHGEHHAHRGLVLAASGRREEALAAFATAARISTYHDTRVLTRLGHAILDLQGSPESRAPAEVIHSELQRGFGDLVVAACRVYPDLASSAAADPETARAMTDAFVKSHDIDLGRRVGLQIPREMRRGGTLSAREREVYDLILQGRTNPEIAKTLFISASTAKVHVRHIFEKLGVHSRAEVAAIRDDTI